MLFRIGFIVASMVFFLVTTPHAGAAQSGFAAGPLEVDDMEKKNSESNISHAQIERFADYTIQDALARMAGVQVNRKGEINLRGAGPGRYSVLIDGQRVGTTGMGDRSVDLSNYSIDMVREINIVKVLTPDMDAEALAGSIHLATNRYNVGEREMDIHVGGGINTRYFPYNGLGSRSFFRYSEALREDVSIDVNLNHQMDQRGWESLQLGYNVADFDEGTVDVAERISPGMHTDTRNRFGGRLQLTFQPNEQDRYHIWGLLNNNSRELVQHRDSWDANEGWTGFSATELQGEQGSYGYDLRFQDIQVQQYMLQAGGRHLFDRLQINYHLGWSQSNFRQENFHFPFMLSGLEYAINMANRSRPSMQVTNVPLQPDGSFRSDLLSLQNMNRIIDDHIDNTYTGRADFTIPFGMGSFRIGSSVRVLSKDGNFTDMNFRDRPTSLNRFSTLSGARPNVLNEEHYRIPNLVDPEKARIFFDNRFPRLRLNEQLHFERSEIWNYSALERIVAGYGMATIELGRFTLLGGARLEYDDMRYTGRRVQFNSAGRFSDSADNTQSTDHLRLFPNAQLEFSPSSITDIRIAWSQSIARPDFNRLAPFELTNRQDTTLFRGNPELKHMVSDNLDLLAEHYFHNAGTISIGLFYKSLSGFVFERQRIIEIEEGDIAGFDTFFRDDETLKTLPVKARSFQNSDETATIYGVEFSWQHHLGFLPGFLSNLGTYANYTWSQSNFKVDYRDDEVRLPGQSPHVVNFALDYTQGRFSSQISYHWTAVMLALDGLQSERRIPPALDRTEPIYMDRYEEGWTSISASIQYRLTNNLILWTDATNLLGGMERVQYDYSRKYYPVEIDYRGGRSVLVGIRYIL